MLKLAHIKPALVLDWLAYWIADLLKLAPILKNGLTDILKLADIMKTLSWLGLTGILTCWHVKIGWHFAKWADWHTETGRHNKTLSWLGLTGILTCWHVKIGWHFAKWADWHTETGRHNKTLSWLGLTGILTCWHVKIDWHFAKWANWHAETGRHNKNSPVMTQGEYYTYHEKLVDWLAEVLELDE